MQCHQFTQTEVTTGRRKVQRSYSCHGEASAQLRSNNGTTETSFGYLQRCFPSPPLCCAFPVQTQVQWRRSSYDASWAEGINGLPGCNGYQTPVSPLLRALDLQGLAPGVCNVDCAICGLGSCWSFDSVLISCRFCVDSVLSDPDPEPKYLFLCPFSFSSSFLIPTLHR